MAGSASDLLATTERVLHIGSEEPLLCRPPRNRAEAMKSADAEEWVAAEDVELANHHKNESFIELIE